ncbi:MAG TPA: pyridoxamine 5'-phosphate oxidase [Usitatibacteraceae bacterium]|nr:pyridoxamine 5'-phosphate oxidase [Usitatibacteraceae bacterium]HRA22722.1 pyridoxamine 5'-phosphate oxidase [Usitatibacteraceae bacterium]
MNIADIRKDYALRRLDESDVDADPFKQFHAWLREAIEAQVPEPTAMTLATAGASGRPAARIMLLKALDDRGFVFYTNYASRKGAELEARPAAALTFFWKELERQVRVEGAIEKVSAAESDEYFASRPLGSRIGAWASTQSATIESRQWLEARVKAAEAQHGESPPRPPHWGGYRVIPDWLEFWQGRQSRLHDRIAYTRGAGGGWQVTRLSP